MNKTVTKEFGLNSSWLYTVPLGSASWGEPLEGLSAVQVGIWLRCRASL